MSEDALIPIGKIVGTHGIKGNLKVISFAESTASFAPGRQLALRREGELVASCTIASASPLKRVIVLALEGIEAVWPTGSNDVYVVREGDKEILIPAIDSVVIEIDLEKEVIQVDLPEGLEA